MVAAVLSGGATPKYAVTGDTVNLAARLDALAAPGDTLLSQSVYSSVSALVDAADLGERAVKGFDSPIGIYRVRALRHAAAERLPFVGRQAELRQLASVLDSVRETKSGVAVAIRGDPGIGKSRLAEELSWRAGVLGFACHFGRVLDFGVAKNQEALPAVVGALLGLAAHAQDAARRSALTRAIESGLVGPQHEALICDLLNLDQRGELQPIFDAMDNATRSRRTAEAVADLAIKAAREQPRLIVFEDIHWGSPLLLGCLAAVAMAARECPLVLAMTTRFEGDPLDRQWRAASRGTPLVTIDVGPLRPDEALVLAGGVMETSNRFALECIQRAEGNPLFLEQLLRNARESEGGNIPATIQSLVLARMDRLPPADKLALQAASVIGKRFSLEALRFLIEDASYRCDALVATDLVRPDSEDYLFAHALIQEGVYSSLLNSRKRELHLRAAQWFREQEPLLHAEHLDRAQHPDAARAHLAAAQAEARRFHYDTALRLAQRGGELAQEEDLRCALAVLRGELLHELARTHDAVAAFERALLLTANDEQRCRAFMGIAAGRRVTGETALAMQALDRAQPIAERGELWAACSRIHGTRGNLYFAQAKVAACGAEHERALEYALRAADPESEALAWSGLGDFAYAQGRMRTALAHFQRCVDLCRQAGLVRTEVPNLCMAGHCLVWGGEGDAGLQAIRTAVERSSRLGLPQIEVMALESVAFSLVFRGDFDEAAQWLDQAIVAARQAGARRYLAVDYLLMSACRKAQGRMAEARELISQAFDLCSQIGMAFLGPSLFVARASAAADPAERRRLLQEGETMLSLEGLAHARLMFYKDAIDVALEDRNWDEALRYAGGLEQVASAEPLPFAELVAARSRALVALARGGHQPGVVEELTGMRERLRYAGIGALVAGIDAALGSS